MFFYFLFASPRFFWFDGSSFDRGRTDWSIESIFWGFFFIFFAFFFCKSSATNDLGRFLFIGSTFDSLFFKDLNEFQWPLIALGLIFESFFLIKKNIFQCLLFSHLIASFLVFFFKTTFDCFSSGSLLFCFCCVSQCFFYRHCIFCVCVLPRENETISLCGPCKMTFSLIAFLFTESLSAF